MFLSIFMLLLLLLFPQESKQGAADGLRLCATAVIPSLFPFFVATRLLPQIRCKRLSQLTHVSEGILSCLLVSFLGGYPIGVSRICAMYEEGQIDKNEAQQAIVFCNNSGPGFFVGMIGGYALQDVRLGLILFVLHILGALLCAFFFRPSEGTYSIRRICPKRRTSGFTDAVSASCESILSVCGLVVLFAIFVSVMSSFEFLSSLPQALIALLFGSIELTSGITLAQNGFVLCAFLMGWGGLCVHLQAMSIWQKYGLTVKNYFLSKLLHGLFSAVFAISYLHGALSFAVSLGFIIIICVIMRNFLKFGVEKHRKLLYNNPKR